MNARDWRQLMAGFGTCFATLSGFALAVTYRGPVPWFALLCAWLAMASYAVALIAYLVARRTGA